VMKADAAPKLNVPKPLVGLVALVVDDDPGFICWLGETLGEIGYQAAPALNTEEAVSLVARLNLQVDVVIVNPKLSGVSEMIQRWSCTYLALMIVAIRTPDNVAFGAPYAHATLDRPSASDQPLRQEWLAMVVRVLNQARQQVQLEPVVSRSALLQLHRFVKN